jgi:lysozyme
MDFAPETIDWFKRFESFRAMPYVDRGGALAIGYGHSNKAGTLPVVVPGMVITEEEATRILTEVDIPYFWGKIAPAIKVELNPYQKGACILISYNIGDTAFRNSTLCKYINEQEWNKAAAQFMKWTKSEGKQLDGLMFRRAQEMCLFRHGWWNR